MDRPPAHAGSSREAAALAAYPPPGAASAPMAIDDFGPRWLGFDQELGDPVEILAFDPALVDVPGLATELGIRVARLAGARHAFYARVRRVDRPTADSLLLVSDHVPGWRLSEVLATASRENLTLDISAVLGLLRQLIPAVALFARHQKDLAIGSIAPQRLILTPQGRLVVAEYVLGPAVEKLQLSRERLWREFRVAVPTTAGVSRITPKSDVIGIGIVTLSLLLGRLLGDDEYPAALPTLSAELVERSGGSVRPLSEGLASWLARTLSFDGRTGFQTPQEAHVAFEEVLARERGYVTTPAILESFIARFHLIAGLPAEPVAIHNVTAVRGVEPEPEPEPPQPPTAPSPGPEVVARVAATPRDRVPARTAAPTPPPEPEPSAPVDVWREMFAENKRDADLAAARAPDPGVEPPPPSPRANAEVPDSPVRIGSILGEMPAPQPAQAESGAVVQPPAATSRWMLRALAGFALVAMLEGIALVWLWNRADGGGLMDEGELVVQSRPVAARVTIDGEDRGTTPLTVRLSAGTHILQVQAGRSEPRVIPLQIRAGVQTAQYVELLSVPTSGAIEIRTEPGRARVTIDGQYRGETPLTIKDLPPGEHVVVLEAGSRQVTQKVRVEPGVTAQLVVPLR